MENLTDNLIGKKFNKLTVLKKSEKPRFYICQCECGKIKEVRKDHLISGNIKSCGCLRKTKPFKLRRDLTGQKFGKLTVLSYSHSDKNHFAYYLCKCECGNTKIVRASNLISGDTKTCGCYNKTTKENGGRLVHGLSDTRLYKIWSHLISRCYNPKDRAYKNYGGRGISVCPEWKNDISNFYNWVLENGYKDNLTIDRINNNGNYEPSNCRFVDDKIQSNNRRNNHPITINNETHNLTEWSRIYNIAHSTVVQRLKRGWSEYDAITTPAIKYH